MNAVRDDKQIFAIERPHRSLWTYYVLQSLVVPPVFPILLTLLYFRFHTMRYRFDEEGISMRWGILFRREIILNYARIQDIHLRSNIVERWLGLARILIQTASGSSSAEMTLEGIQEFEAVRDFLYSRMRGVKDTRLRRAQHSLSTAEETSADRDDLTELTAALKDVSRELRAIQAELGSSPKPGQEDKGCV